MRQLATDFAPARRVAMRFVAGESIDSAIDVARDLNARGMTVSLDELGEAVTDAEVARRAADSYRVTLRRMDAAGVDGSISVKLTQLGLDVSLPLARDLVASICDEARSLGRHVTVDMEGSDYTAQTVDLVVGLRADGHDNVGCAVQAYLHRTREDVDRLVGAGASLRLCKGAYLEPPAIAFQDAADIDANYARLAERLLTSGTYARIATHDHRIVHHVRNLERRHRIDRDAFEFQMLFGVRTALQETLVDAGYRLRVYVPFGEQWYPYFMRRIAERPANLAFFLRALAGSRARDDGQPA